ncbi:MAG TPA: histidine kinase dimerization/phospho-acceptor domain-containing protein [Nitrospiria bacterium]|nr:histidine kinase dimerization/phospho-acceptor domain-containing protein [Nitrospiria bacterium]
MKQKIGAGSEPAFQKTWSADPKPPSSDQNPKTEEVLIEFRNQLTALVGNLSIFLDTCKQDTPSAYRLGNAREAARKAEQLVQDLLDLSRKEIGVK